MRTITLDVRIENTYTEHGEFTHERAVSVEAPGSDLVVDGVLDEALLEDWATEELLPLTGEGLDGDALYEVTVLRSPDLPVLAGKKFGWQG